MIHLRKTFFLLADTSAGGIACTNSPFIRGRGLSVEEFKKAESEGKKVCKKCAAKVPRTK